jgi:hypothetical protein
MIGLSDRLVLAGFALPDGRPKKCFHLTRHASRVAGPTIPVHAMSSCNEIIWIQNENC